MRICDYTLDELYLLIDICNFTDAERQLLDYRSREYSLEDCAEFLHVSVSTVKRINRRMKDKIRRAYDSRLV